MTTTSTEKVEVPANFHKGAKPTSHQLRRRRAVLNMLQGLKGKVLDFGCGYGDLAYAISQTNEVCGVDLDAQRVAFAAKEYAPLEFKQCSTDDAPYPDQSFDIVASIVVINFIPDAASHLRAIRRLLKDDGHLILACKSDDVLRNGVRRMFGRPPVPSKLHMRSREEIRRLLAEHHFSIERESYFYDPPFSGWKNPGDAAFRTVEAFLSLVQVASTAGYFLMLCKKQPA